MDSNIVNEEITNTPQQLKSNLQIKFKNKRYLILLLIILLISTMILIYLYFRSVRIKKQSQLTNNGNNSSVTLPSDWKIYKNDDYGYSFSYPSSWEVIEANSGKSTTSEVVGSNLFDNELQKTTLIQSVQSASQIIFIISIENNPDNYNTDSWADNFIVPLVTDRSVNLAKFVGGVMIDDTNAKKFSVSAYDSESIIIGLVKNKLIYKFNYTVNTNNEINDIYDKILSSFKFKN